MKLSITHFIAVVLFCFAFVSCENEHFEDKQNPTTSTTQDVKGEEKSGSSCKIGFAKNLGYKIIVTSKTGKRKIFGTNKLDFKIRNVGNNQVLDIILNIPERLQKSSFFASGIRAARLISVKPLTKKPIQMSFEAFGINNEAIVITEEITIKKGQKVRVGGRLRKKDTKTPLASIQAFVFVSQKLCPFE